MTKLQQLKDRIHQHIDFRNAARVLNWDLETYMPPGGLEARSEQIATLEQAAHNILIDDRVGRLLEDLEPETRAMDYDSDDASLVRVTRRVFDRARRIPPGLVAEFGRATTLASEHWRQARRAADFPRFLPYLERVLDLRRQMAEAWGYETCPYDALIEIYEPGMRRDELARIFDDLKRDLVPIVQALAGQQDRVDASVLRGDYDEQKQWDFGRQVIERLGFDFQRGRLDRATHPFTDSFSIGDVRLTTRVDPRHFAPAFFGTVHEAGHGMYDQGFAPELERTLLAEGTSSGVHESQSRMWENVVARSRGFWRFWFPHLKQDFPSALSGVGEETFYRAVNRVLPSPIRVEADEVTYCLHIFVRFELEDDLLEGRLQPADLPEAWNAKMRAYLGFTPANDAQGVLQDIHWSMGLVGYFPSYALGSLLAVQLYNQAVQELPAIPEEIERGDFSSLFGWMRSNVHRHGRKFTPVELVQRITGGPISARPFVNYIREKYGQIYDL